MKKLTKKFVILLLFVLLLVSVALLASCKGNPLTRDDLEEMGYNVVVTYDFNGGINNDSLRSVTIYVRSGSRIPEPGGKGASFGSPSKSNCSFRGFYLGTETENGIEYAETPWDFESDTVTEDVTLYALWWENYVLAVHCDDAVNHVEEIQLSRDALTGVPEVVQLGYVSASQLKMTGRTILGYYMDAECSDDTELTFPNTLPFSAENDRIDIYVKSLQGNWVIIRSSNDFVNGFNSTANIYIKNDIDFEGKTVKFPDSYSGTFDGNGKTLSNIMLEQAAPSNASGTVYFGLFRELTGNAIVKNVVFSNLTLKANSTGNRRIQEYCIGLFAGSVNSNVTLNNVTVSGKLIYVDNTDATVEVDPFVAIKGSVDISTCNYDGITVEKVSA